MGEGNKMKYLFLDTNIYLDSIVLRNKSNKAEIYEYLIKLLEYGEIRLIVPEIVINEVFNHVDNEINKIGDNLKEIRSRAKGLYWINHVEELKSFDNSISDVKKCLNEISDKYDNNKERYKTEYLERLNKIFNHKNTIKIKEDQTILNAALTRKIYKKMPFHLNDVEKDSMADAIIIETLINFRPSTGISADDKIYFISKNWRDFSADKDNKNVFHDDILNSIKEKNLTENINYSTLFAETLLTEFKDEINNVNIAEELENELKWEEEELKRESIESYYENIRESAGLSPLSGTDWEYKVSCEKKVQKLIDLINEMEEEFKKIYYTYKERYMKLENTLDTIQLRQFNSILQDNTLFSALIGADGLNSNINLIKNNIKSLFIDLYDIEKITEYSNEEGFSLNTTIAKFYDNYKNEYKVEVIGYLSPCDDDEDTIDIYFYKNNIREAEGSITVYYGYFKENDDGGAGDGAEEDIRVYLDDLIDSIDTVKDRVVNDIQVQINTIKKINDIFLNQQGRVLSFV